MLSRLSENLDISVDMINFFAIVMLTVSRLTHLSARSMSGHFRESWRLSRPLRFRVASATGRRRKHQQVCRTSGNGCERRRVMLRLTASVRRTGKRTAPLSNVTSGFGVIRARGEFSAHWSRLLKFFFKKWGKEKIKYKKKNTENLNDDVIQIRVKL